MVVSLPPELELFAQQQVNNGRFVSVDDFVAAAVRTFVRQQQEQTARLAAEIKKGLDQLERGEGIEFDDDSLEEFFDTMAAEVEAELEAERAKQLPPS